MITKSLVEIWYTKLAIVYCFYRIIVTFAVTQIKKAWAKAEEKILIIKRKKGKNVS